MKRVFRMFCEACRNILENVTLDRNVVVEAALISRPWNDMP